VITKKSRRKGRAHISKRPFVVATFAMTVDGKVTTKNLAPVDFTSREDKLHLFRQRALADRAGRSENRDPFHASFIDTVGRAF